MITEGQLFAKHRFFEEKVVKVLSARGRGMSALAVVAAYGERHYSACGAIYLQPSAKHEVRS